MSVDVEIYMNNFIKFFRENPNDLLNLIPKDKEEVFYQKIRETVYDNYDKGEDVILTQRQIIEVCIELNQPSPEPIENSIKNVFAKTEFGEYCLN